jgi:hypothetical protein
LWNDDIYPEVLEAIASQAAHLESLDLSGDFDDGDDDGEYKEVYESPLAAIASSINLVNLRLETDFKDLTYCLVKPLLEATFPRLQSVKLISELRNRYEDWENTIMKRTKESGPGEGRTTEGAATKKN